MAVVRFPTTAAAASPVTSSYMRPSSSPSRTPSERPLFRPSIDSRPGSRSLGDKIQQLALEKPLAMRVIEKLVDSLLAGV